MTVEQGEQFATTSIEHKWQVQSSAINGALKKQGVQNSEISGGIHTDSLWFNVRTQLDLGIEKLRAIGSDLGKALGTKGVRINQVLGGLRVEIAREEDVAVPLLDLLSLKGDIPAATATLGLTESGEAILHDFSSANSPHLLVIGGQDSGKTTLLRTIAVSLAMENRQSAVQMVAICPSTGDQDQQNKHASAWLPLSYLPHMLCDVAVKHTDITEVLSFLVREVEYREKNSFCEPRIILVIDQADTIIKRGGRQCAEPIHRLVQKGEDVGIHVVLGARSIDSGVLSTQLLTDLSVRIFGRTDQVPDSRLLPSTEDLNSKQLLGEGDFYLRHLGRTSRMQAALIDDYDLHQKLTEMYRHQAILLAQPYSTRVRLDRPKDQGVIPKHQQRAAPSAAAVS